MPGFRPTRGQALVLILLFAWLGGRADARADDREAVRKLGCGAIAALVDATPGQGAVVLPSYPGADLPALKTAGFVYDNALAVIALVACHDTPRAARIGAALRIAASHDRFWHDGRIRNAYRAGTVAEGAAPLLPGWWDAAANRWDEDDYQVGTATGNVAWAALALVTLARATHDDRDLAAARSLMAWISHTEAMASGFAGGWFGEEPSPTRLAWLSTEHNVDAAAVFHALGDTAGEAKARGFVASMWDGATGRFWLGTLDDGHSINRGSSAIDAELWPLIGIADAPPDWSRARVWVQAHHATGGGYGFRDAPDGVWTEGTAQAALALPDHGVFGLLRRQQAPDGLLYASPEPHISTGLALRPDSTTDDFYYFHLPHLGATAWAVLAATGTNPFR